MAQQTSITVEQRWFGNEPDGEYTYVVTQTVNTLAVCIGQNLNRAEVQGLIDDGHKVTVKAVS